MSAVLPELEQVLRIRQEKLTPQEENVLLACKSKAVRQFTVGALLGGGGVWAATWRLSKLHRFSLSGGAAVIFGIWRFGRSLDSCVDHILALDGTRMQKELATIMVKKYRDDPWMMQRVSKHFFSEEVYDDTSLEPKLRWRYKNFFSDNVAQGQRTHDTGSQDSSSDSHYSPPADSQASHGRTESRKTDFVPKPITVNAGGNDVISDPLDWVFGSTAVAEEIHQPVSPSRASRVGGRAHRRSRRRHRSQHQDGSVEHPTE